MQTSTTNDLPEDKDRSIEQSHEEVVGNESLEDAFDVMSEVTQSQHDELVQEESKLGIEAGVEISLIPDKI